MLFAGAFTTTLPQALPAPSMWKSPLRAVHVPSLLNTVSASLAPYSDRLYRISGVEKPMESSLKTLRAKLLCFRPALLAPPLLVLFIFLREKKDKSFFRMRGCGGQHNLERDSSPATWRRSRSPGTSAQPSERRLAGKVRANPAE